MTSESGTVQIGVVESVDVTFDVFGVPHISAQNILDAFRAQGFIVARARLAQLEIWRRRGLGRLAEVFGPDFYEADRASRLFLYRGSLEEEWEKYGSSARDVVSAYTSGINDFIRWCTENPQHLPRQYHEWGFSPEQWDASDLIRIRTHGWYAGAKSQVARARLLCRSGLDAVRRRFPSENCPPTPVPSLDASVFDTDVLETYRLAFDPLGAVSPGTPDGSNNWVIDGTRTESGRPLLANDPHRAFTDPSLRFVSHLRAPGLDIVGAGEPAAPGISIGHNGRVAFGLTISPFLSEDVMVYELDDTGARYRYDGKWREFDSIEESISVRGQSDIKTVFDYSVHGPVIHRHENRPVAFGLRATYLDAGMAPYLGSMRFWDAESTDDFKTALAGWGTPGENWVFADIHGSIGQEAAGRVPRRLNWDGTFPVPGDGSFEWAGTHGSASIRVRRESVAWAASANEFNLDAKDVICGDWAPPYRYEQISKRLQNESLWTVEAAADMQNDATDGMSLTAIAVIASSTVAMSTPAGRFLTAWDGKFTADSPGAALFAIWWWGHARPRILSVMCGDRDLDDDDWQAGDPREEIALLREISQEGVVGKGPRFLVETLVDAWSECARRMGDSVSDWRWDRVASLAVRSFTSPFDGRLDPVVKGRTGSPHAIATAWLARDYVQHGGASFRMVLDVGDWDASVFCNAPGQAAEPLTPQMVDLRDIWTRGENVPLVFTTLAIQRFAADYLRLVPDGHAGRIDAYRAHE